MNGKKKRRPLRTALCAVLIILVLCPLGVAAAVRAGATVPIYGNCCNLSYTNTGVPIDYLDLQCSEYNERHQANGGFDREAALELIRDVKTKISDMNGSTKVAAHAVVAFFQLRVTLSDI